MPKRTSQPPSLTPEAFLAGLPRDTQALAQRLRTIIKTTLPEGVERVYPGWRGIGYRHPEAGYICAIFILPDMVKLGFEHSALLTDTHGLLVDGPSAGKQVRYVEFRRLRDIRVAPLRALLREAIAIRGRRL